MIAASRLRKGNVASGHGAARLVADAVVTARAAGATGALMVRADSAYYRRDVIAAALRAKAWFSVTVRMNPSVRQAISGIPEQSWTTIRYPRAIWDEAEQRFISEAEVAETNLTAFTSHPKARQVTCRLVVRRVRRLNHATRAAAQAGQDELFTSWRHHGFVTNSPLPTVQADEIHRDHAVVEQVIAELKDGPLAHAPSGKFTANAAWLALACIAFNLLRAAGSAASVRHAKARWATAHPPGRRPGPDRLHRSTPDLAPADPLALGRRLGRPLEHRHHLTTRPDRPCRNDPDVEEPDRPATRPRPHHHRRTITPQNHEREHRESAPVDHGSANSGQRTVPVGDLYPHAAA